MANFFDQFDAPEEAKPTKSNFFDQFDALAEPPKRSWLEAGQDVGLGLVKGAVGVAKLAPMAVGAIDTVISKAFGLGEPASGGALANPMTRGLDDISQNLDKKKSANMQAKEAVAAKQAEITGQQYADTLVIGDVPVGQMAAEFASRFWSGVTDPGMLVQGLAENVATVLPSGMVARGAQAAAEVGVPMVAKTLAKEAVEKTARTAGVAAGISTGAVQQGSDVASEAYNKILQLPPEVWAANPRYAELVGELGKEKAKQRIAGELATEAGIKAGLESLAVNAVGAKFGGAAIESAFLKPATSTGKGAVAGSAFKSGVRGGFGESLTEGAEEGYGAYAGNQALAQVDPNTNVWQGVGAAGGQGAAVALGLGSVAGAREGTAAGLVSRQRAIAEQQLKDARNAGEVAAAAETLAGTVDELAGAVDAYLGNAGVPVQAVAEVAAANAAADAAASGEPLPTPGRPTIPQLRERADRDAAANAEPLEFDRRMGLEQLDATRQAAPRVADAYVDLTPMDERLAGQRLAVLRDMTANEGGNALELAIVPHPGQPGKFAIGRQSVPSLDISSEPAPLAEGEAQQRLESAALAGEGQQARAGDAPRQTMISRVMANIEARGGVASPAEAEILRAANLGQPYNRIDPNLSTRPASTDEKLTGATGIAVGSEAGLGYGARESTRYEPTTPFQYTPGAQGQKRTEVPTAPEAPSLERTFVEQMRKTNTPAARAFVQMYDGGRITDADVTAALEAQRQLPASAQERIEGAAAQAPTAEAAGIQVEQLRRRGVSPELASAVAQFGKTLYTSQDLTVEGAAERVARAGQQARATPTGGIELAPSLSPRSDFEGRTEAINTRLPRPARVGGVLASSLTDEQLRQTAGNAALPAITRRGAQIELLAREQEQRQANPSTAPNEGATARLEAAAAQGRVAQPSDGRIILTNVKMSTQRLAPGEKTTIRDGDTEHEITAVEPGKLGATGRLLAQIARIFGKRLVVFQSATAKVDGFVRDGDNESIFINAESQMSPLAVFGHELTHLLKRDNPRAYAALQAVVERELGEGAMDKFEQEYGAGANLEELTSDLVGNRFQEADFWTEVFNEIAAQNPEGARGIITRLAAALTKAINAFLKLVRQPGFQADAYVKDLNAIKAAVKTALAQYAQDQRATAMQMEGEVTQEQSKVALAGPRPAFQYTPQAQGKKGAALGVPNVETGERILASRERPAIDSWEATPDEVDQAETYEEKNGILPYTSEGQLAPEVEADQTRFSVKRRGKYANHPVFDIPLNKNGTVTLYYPATNAIARSLVQDKKLRGATPQSNRIYLTNESSGPKVMQNPGNIEQTMDGANVLIQIDPAFLQLDQEYEDGRKDFFIQIGEGEAFAKKMAQTKLFTLDAPRTKALSKDTKLVDLERRISAGVDEYLALPAAERKARLKAAKELIKREHNVGTLLGENGKLEKTRIGDYGLTYDGKSVASLGLGLASAQKINEQNLSTCPKSAICEGLCLGETSGQNRLYGGDGQFKSGPRLSQYLKTEAMVQHPEEFGVLLHAEIERFTKKAKREDFQVAIRLNVTSDFRPQTFAGLIRAFPDVMFYDYTKLPTKSIAANHHLTYSSTGASQVVDGKTIRNPESNWDKMVQRMLEGNNVAMAFTSRTDMPDFILDERTGERFQVWNGDKYDARFLDPKPGEPGNLLNRGMIVGLTNKDATTKPELAAEKHKGFFLDYNRARDGDTLTIRDQSALAEETPARRTIPLKPVREAARVQASRQRKADEIPRDDLAGRAIKIDVRVQDTGDTATLTLDAKEALDDLDEREAVMNRLLECIGK